MEIWDTIKNGKKCPLSITLIQPIIIITTTTTTTNTKY